MAAVLKMLELQ